MKGRKMKVYIDYVDHSISIGEWPARLGVKSIEDYPGTVASVHLCPNLYLSGDAQTIQLRRKDNELGLFLFQYYNGPEYFEGWWKDSEVIWEYKNWTEKEDDAENL
jgi:hypothetical protein